MGKVNPRLASARAYWRLQAKAFRAGNYAQAEQYNKTAERLYRQYLRDKEAADRAKAMRATAIRTYPQPKKGN